MELDNIYPCLNDINYSTGDVDDDWDIIVLQLDAFLFKQLNLSFKKIRRSIQPMKKGVDL